MKKLISLIREKAISYGKFNLASGKSSDYYVDMSKVSLTTEGITEIVNGIGAAIDWKGIDSVGGPVLGATSIVSGLVMQQLVYRGFFVRKEAKEHGDQQIIEGNLQAGDRVVMVEDVVTSGNSLLRAVNAVEQAGAKVVALIAVLDRQEGAREMFERLGYYFTSLVVVSDVLEKS